MTATTATAKPAAPIKTNRPMPRPPINVKAPPSPVAGNMVNEDVGPPDSPNDYDQDLAESKIESQLRIDDLELRIEQAAESELALHLQIDEANDKVFCLKHVIASIDRVVAQAFVAESNRDMEFYNALSGLLRVAKRIA